MDVQNLSPVLPVDDVAAAAKVWSVLLGCEPKFVDADRWALFEIGGRRLALAGTDRDSDIAGVMVKTDDLAVARERAQSLGLVVGPLCEGAHETRFTATAPGGWPVTFYAPRAA